MKFFNKNMKLAALGLTLLHVLLTLLAVVFPSSAHNFATISFSLAVELIFSSYLILLVYSVRDPAALLGVWGYVWRSIVLRYLSLVAAVVLSMIVLARPVLPSLPFTVFLYFFSFVFAPMFAWLFFSMDRRGQLVWAAGLIK